MIVPHKITVEEYEEALKDEYHGFDKILLKAKQGESKKIPTIIVGEAPSAEYIESYKPLLKDVRYGNYIVWERRKYHPVYYRDIDARKVAGSMKVSGEYNPVAILLIWYKEF